MHKFTLTAALVLLAAIPANARWLPARGQSCVDACRAVHARAVASGLYQNGEPFAICRASPNGEGMRPGYNLQPNWAAACWVAHGGQEKSIAPYDCLCDR